MRTETIEIYQFNELDTDAQERAIDNCRDFQTTGFDWWDFTYDDAKECAKCFGLDIDQIHFSGFWSQGDGACFEGSYAYRKGALKALREHAPLDTELHRIAEALQNIQRRYFYAVQAGMRQSGHYYHEYCMTVSADIDTWSNPYAELSGEDEDAITVLMRDFARWIYRRLESEYEYLTSDECIREMLESGGYEFNADGTLY